MDYANVEVNTITVKADTYSPDLLEKLTGLTASVGIKGGVAREMLKVALGITKSHSPDKISDVDLVVFEKPQETRDKRISRRDHYASKLNVEPKDLEFLDAGEAGLTHYFLTRDVTMNEVLIFKAKNAFRIMFTPACEGDLRNKVIRPSVHCAHSGLDVVWVKRGTKIVIHPNIVRRCIYRRVKEDGIQYDFDSYSREESRDLFSIDLLFKLSKRFMDDPVLFKKCCDALIEFGFDSESVQVVVGMSADYKEKPKVNLTSEKVEDLLEMMNESFELWSAQNTEPCFHAKAKVLFM